MKKKKNKKNPQNRQYKDSVFVDLFSKDRDYKENFLSLYNALHNTNLKLSETQIQPLKLNNVLYMAYRNDVSMLINGQIIVLVEHQSTVNENMPLRFLEYASRLYEKYLPSRDKYMRKIQKIPLPEFYVFYNGTEEYPSECTLKLSNAFTSPITPPEQKSNTLPTESPLELLVKVYNINKCTDTEILKKCCTLRGYSEFIQNVREASLTLTAEDAFTYAVKKSISEGYLSEYLTRNSKEVINMLTSEYCYATDIAVQREEEREIAKEKYLKQGLEQGLEQGALKKAYENAQNLLRMNVLTDKQIEQATGLTSYDLYKIKNNC